MAIYWSMVQGQDDSKDEEPHPFRWERIRNSYRRYFTWIYVTRALGVAGLYYEVVVDKIDKPSVMIVLGAMILGTETIRNIFGGGR